MRLKMSAKDRRHWLALFDMKWKENANGCHVWQRCCVKGYGRFHINRHSIQAHRVSYMLKVGPIPNGLLVCHKCDEPLCVNPDHLFLGTWSENSKDMVKKNRQAFGEKHGCAKLTEKEVMRIKKENGPSISVGRKYGVDPSLIRMIRRGKIWRHI